MSDNDDIEVESDADKRAHHNALERKRRDHIKDSFHSLRDSVPSLQGEKASRAQILDKATEYIQYMRRKNHTHQQDIDDLKRQNALLEQQGALPAVRVTPGVRWSCKVLGVECTMGKRELIKFFVPGEFTSLPPSWKMQVKGNASNHLVRALEKARSSAQLQTNYPSSDNSLYTNAKGGTISAFDGGSDSSSESEPEEPQSRKKLRMEAS